MSDIPIQNLYYLLCYAWDRLDQGGLVDVNDVPSTELVDLFATVLRRGVEHVGRRGFELGYDAQDQELRGIRGRIDISTTARRFLVKHGRSACSFDELTTNTPANQIIKATLRVLARDPAIDPRNRLALLTLNREFHNVDDISVTSQSFRTVQLGANQRFYRFLLSVCRLIHDSTLVEEEKGIRRFRDFLRDEDRMAYVFQDFVYNFLRIERPDLDVCREVIQWEAVNVEGDSECDLLPQMRTDVSVFACGKKVIIDTKYYQETLTEHHGSAKIHSENLYQLFSYLVNASRGGEAVEGILLYPVVDRPLSISYSLCGIPIRIQTLNLAQPWRDINRDLKQLVQ
jgi:5-methylcytosine-specific restriction enzyme subunit McrC